MSKQLTKLTVNLIPQAVKALKDAAELTGDTETDTVNRALQVYWLVAGGMTAARALLEAAPVEDPS